MATEVKANSPIHPKFDERISVKVEGQLPGFVKQDHETFVAFMEAYYEYMEQEGKPYEIIGNLDKYANLDKTTDDFLKYFKKQFAEDLPEAIFANQNKPWVLKHLREFYRAKGSEKAFQFLFRLLYKEEITFYYPGTDLLRTSDGKYNTSRIIRTVDTSGTDMIFSVTGKQITGKTSGATAVVEQVVNENIGVFTVSTIFLSGVVGTFERDEKVAITGESWDFTLGGMLTDTTIISPGNNYQVGDVIPVVGGGSTANGSLVEVEELSTGSIATAVINNGGTGYKVGDKLTIDNTGNMYVDGRTASILVNNVDANGTILGVEIENVGRGYSSLPTVTGGGSGNGLDITFTGWGVGGIEKLKIIKHGYGFESNPTLDFSGKGDGTAEGVAIISAYEDQYQAGFFSNDGFLSSNKYLQDSFYYQLFSYVITSGVNISNWRDYIKRAAHPAGLALFGNIQLVSLLDLQMKITGIPQRRHYTIIFHDGTIVPPVVLDIGVRTCDEHQNKKISRGDNYGFIVDTPTESANDFGAITDGFIEFIDDYDLITNTNVFFPAPTKCQTYEQDLAIQKLINIRGQVEENLIGYEDFGHIHNAHDPSLSEDHGLIISAETSREEFGRPAKTHASIKTPTTLRTEKIAGLKDGHHVTQLRLGPIRRTTDRRKWRKYNADSNVNPPASRDVPAGLGGLSSTLSHTSASGTVTFATANPGKVIKELKDVQIVDYVLYGGLKERIVNGSVITRFQTETPPSFDATQVIGNFHDHFMRFYHDRPINI